MNNISLLLPKKRRPVWTPELQAIDEDLNEYLDSESSAFIEIPLLGMITAGKPIECVEDYERIKVPANMVRKDTYALKVSGHSMIDDNIQDGDIVTVSEKAISTAMGNIVDESKFSSGVASRGCDRAWVRPLVRPRVPISDSFCASKAWSTTPCLLA